MHMKKSVYFAVVYECTPQFAAPLKQKHIDQKLVLKGIAKQMELFSRIFAVSVCNVLTHCMTTRV